MKILLGSSNLMVIRRWLDLLSPAVIDQAVTLADVRQQCAAKHFDLILLHRPLLNIADFVALRTAFSRGRFFLLSDHPHEKEGLAFLKAGIAGYANTYISKDRLVEAVRVIADGGVWLGQKLVQRLILDTVTRKPEQAAPEVEKILAGLTKMERKVAGMIARGLTNLEIAAALGVTERTVKAHLTAVYGKTGTGNRLNLALLINRQN